MRTRWVILVVGLAGVAAGTSAALRFWPRRPPTLVCPSAVDCAPTEAGQVTVARFDIHNGGDASLHLTDVRTSCGCAGLEYEAADGRYVRPAEVLIAPRSFGRLLARVAVSLPTDEPTSQSITFRTNDPARPEHRLTLTIPPVAAGLRAEPRAVLFGAVPVGETAERVVTVTDARHPARRIGRVSVPPDAGFAARLLPADSALPGVTRVAVTFTPPAAGAVEGQVELWADGAVAGTQPTRVAVHGRGAVPAELVPASVFLPLAADAGPVYETVVLCRVPIADGRAIRVETGALPTGLRVTTDPPGPTTRLRVRYDRPAGTATDLLTVPVAVTVGGQTHRLTLTVHVAAEG